MKWQGHCNYFDVKIPCMSRLKLVFPAIYGCNSCTFLQCFCMVQFSVFRHLVCGPLTKSHKNLKFQSAEYKAAILVSPWFMLFFVI